MKEDVYFWSPPGEPRRAIFVHAHLAVPGSGRVVIFVNPLFDEKRRVQRFQAGLARALCAQGASVYRYDHFGTGDSGGELHEFDCAVSLCDLGSLCAAIREVHGGCALEIFGIRFGADLGMRYACSDTALRRLWLLEPLGDGARFLKEQRVRRQMHRKINRMVADAPAVIVAGREYDDHQGYLVSPAVRAFMEELGAGQPLPEGKRFCLFRFTRGAPRAAAGALRAALAKSNDVRTEEIGCPEFWATQEPPDLAELTARVCSAFHSQPGCFTPATASANRADGSE